MARVVDEHMYQGGETSCRLQIFVPRRGSAVAVATQYGRMWDYERGASLTNAAGRVATAVWREFLSTRRKPPVWIQRYTPEPDADEVTILNNSWAVVSFKVDRRRRELSSPSWCGITVEAVAELTGESVDPTRGHRYEPPPPPDTKTIDVFKTVDVRTFPATSPFRVTSCMGGAGTALRSAAETAASGCCWYHGGSWATANRVAIEALSKAARGGPGRYGNIVFDAAALLEEFASGGWEVEAAKSLLLDPITIRNGGWVNGQHRGQAIIDGPLPRALIRDVLIVSDITLPDRTFRDVADENTCRRIDDALVGRL